MLLHIKKPKLILADLTLNVTSIFNVRVGEIADYSAKVK